MNSEVVFFARGTYSNPAGLEKLTAEGTEKLYDVLCRSKKPQTKKAKQAFMYRHNSVLTHELDMNVSLNSHGIVNGDVIEVTSESLMITVWFH
jgi:hypothetical protein